MTELQAPTITVDVTQDNIDFGLRMNNAHYPAVTGQLS